MADDIAARITIAIENADAIKRCEQVEESLRKVSAAREDDLSISQQSTKQTEANAEALQKEADALDFSDAGRARHLQKLKEEAEALRKLAEAQKEQAVKNKPSYEPGISIDEAWKQTGQERPSTDEREKIRQHNAEEQKKINDLFEQQEQQLEQKKQQRAEREAQRQRAAKEQEIEAEKFAAEKAMFAREKAEAQAQDLIAKRTFVSEEASKKELAQIDLIIARRKYQAAVEQELALKQKFENSQKNLAEEVGKGDRGADPRRVQALTNATRMYEDRLIAAQRATLLAEKALNKANNELAESATAQNVLSAANNKTQKTTSALTMRIKILLQAMQRGLLRTAGLPTTGPGMNSNPIAGLPRITGGTPGMGKAPGSGGAATALVAVFAVMEAFQIWGDYIRQEREAEDKLFNKQLDSQRQFTERVRRESEENSRYFSELDSFSQKGVLSHLDRFNQSMVIDKLRENFHDMSIEVNNATGKIKNLASLRIEKQFEEGQAEVDAISAQIKAIDARIEHHKKDLNDTNAIVQAFKTKVMGVNDIVYNRDALDRLYSERDQAMADLEKKRKFLPDNIEKEKAKEYRNSWAENYARSQDLLKQIAEFQRSSRDWKINKEMGGDKSKINARQEELDLKRLDALRKQSEKLRIEMLNAEIDLNTTDPKNVKRKAESMEDYKNALQARIPLLREIDALEKAQFEREQARERINKDLARQRENIRFQEMINNGQHREVEILKENLEIQKKIKEEGYTSEQIEAFKQINQNRKKVDLEKQQRESFASMSKGIQLRDTSQNAVLANSVEALRLQSRMLLNTNPQQKLITINQQHTRLLSSIDRGVNKNTQQAFTVVSI